MVGIDAQNRLGSLIRHFGPADPVMMERVVVRKSRPQRGPDAFHKNGSRVWMKPIIPGDWPNINLYPTMDILPPRAVLRLGGSSALSFGPRLRRTANTT